MASQKLQSVFNENSEKLVDLKEVTKLQLKEYNSQLSKLEFAKIFATALSKKHLSSAAAALLSLTLSGEILESSDGRTFLTVKSLEKLNISGGVSKKLEEKADNATADALRKATDYRSQKQSLGLKPAL